MLSERYTHAVIVATLHVTPGQQESLDYMAGLADFGENIALEHAHPDEAEWEDWGQVSACLQHIREELTGVMMPDGK